MAEGRHSGAWQPFTFGGVARFAYAPLARLVAITGVLGLVCGGAVAWFFATAWAPVIQDTIGALPSQGAISQRRLHWPSASGQRLGGNRFLAIIVNPAGGAVSKESADVLLEFQGSALVVRSFLGYTTIAYPSSWDVQLSKGDVEPLWGAWKPAVLAGAVVVPMVALMLLWGGLALLYMVVPGSIGLYIDREITTFGAWKLSCAAQMPGAILMCFGIGLYALGEITLLHLCFIAAAHFLAAWAFVVLSPMGLRRISDAPARAANPFGRKKKSRAKKNPFRDEEEAEFEEASSAEED